MPQDGAGNYQYPPGTPGIPDQTIESEAYNTFLDDLVMNDLNIPRPVHRGGTGASSADASLVNLHGEKAEQVVSAYLSHLWLPGSFRSAVGATDAPVAGHTFSGICYINEPLLFPPTNANVVVEARDQNDITTPGRKYIREKKSGTWGPWVASESDRNQVVTDYNTHVFYPGPFRSVAAANSPIAAHNFAGICYLNEKLEEPPTNANFVIEARDESGTEVPGTLYVREKRAGVWTGPWKASGSNTVTGDVIVNSGDVIINNPLGTANEIHGQVPGALPTDPPEDRWVLVLGDGTVEDGTPPNDGSNFLLKRYNDAGVLIDAVMTVNRSTGIGNFLYSPTGPTPAVADVSKKLATTEFVTSAINTILRANLLNNTNFYVSDAIGSDAYDGSQATVGAVVPGEIQKGPKKTITAAINMIYEDVDTRGFDVTINLAGGTYTTGVVLKGSLVGDGVLTLLGSTSNPASVELVVSTAACINASNNGRIVLSGLSLMTTGGGSYPIISGGGALVTVGPAVRFGPSVNACMFAGAQGRIFILDSFEVYGSNGIGLWTADGQANIYMQPGKLVTFTGTPNLGAYLARCNQLSYLNVEGLNFAGACTVTQKFFMQANSVIVAGTAISNWPGAAGSSDASSVLL